MIAAAALIALQQVLAPAEQRIVARVDAEANQAIELLAKTVDINSGTLNRAGVRKLADVFAPEFEKLGFRVRYEVLPDSLNRGGHLIAERKGTRGKRLLLIGHLDTVFEEDSPFQRFQRIDAVTASGPGVGDMKGGIVVMLQALRALNEAGALDDATITVFLTGDEESPGKPFSVARASLIEASRNSDIALAFEGGSRDADGDMFVIARRGTSEWTLRVNGKPAHSSGVFGESTGAGAIFEAARILDRFYAEVRGERNITFNPALIVGGSEVSLGTAEGSTAGKTNIVAAQALVRGDLRTLTDEETARTRDRMRAIVAQSLPHTSAEITFLDGYPTMPPTAGNRGLLKQVDEINRALGLGAVRAFDPASRGAGDVSFVAKYVDAIDALGPVGTASHTVNERVDLPSLRTAAQRAAVLIYRLASAPRTALNDIAGHWKVQAMALDRDTVLTSYQLWASEDTSAWKIKFDERPDTIRLRVLHIASDSIMIQAGPYRSALRNTMVTTRTTLRMREGQLHGRSTARYDSAPPDSLRVRTLGVRVR